MNNVITQFCNAGLYLIQIPRGTKAPHHAGWNKQRSANNQFGYSNVASDFNSNTNIGLAHVPSGTMSLDIDDLSECLALFATLLPIKDWLDDESRVEIRSGKDNRRKLIFRLPPGVSFHTQQYQHNKTMLFELRNSSKNGCTVQDVIAGTHPEGTTYKLVGDIANIPTIPDQLLDVALNWRDWKHCFDSVLNIAPTLKIAPQPTQGALSVGCRDPIKEFNQSRTLVDVLEGNGYKRAGDDRFIRPGSSSNAPGIAIVRNCNDGVERAFSHAGDVLNDDFAHDAFDCFRLLEHGGDFSQALNWSQEITKHNQRLYKTEQAQRIESVDVTKKPFSLAQFSLMGKTEVMEKQMLEDVFVLDGIAVRGQATAIYAEFNTGKTLLVLSMLIESVKAGRINGGDVFYINVDDDYKGLVTKNGIVEQYGMHMIADMNGFSCDAFAGYMQTMIDEDTARGKIIILDTLKKFTDLMDKKIGTGFMKQVRKFIQAGGTVIMLAHTNKNRQDGRAIYGGTNDVPSDCDCVFTLDTLNQNEMRKQVTFKRIKSRANVEREKTFSYDLEVENYHDLLSSVVVDAVTTKTNTDDKAIKAITNAIELGDTLKTELIVQAYTISKISKAKLNAVLAKYVGVLWVEVVGEHNAKSYELTKILIT